MTIQGARDELINMMECKDIPFYFVPILQKVVETIEMEFATACDIEQIRAEIRQIVDEETKHDETWARGLHYALCIIDKYTKGEPG